MVQNTKGIQESSDASVSVMQITTGWWYHAAGSAGTLLKPCDNQSVPLPHRR